jgi:hypothetical protein
MTFVDEIINMAIGEIFGGELTKKGIPKRERQGDADEIMVG